MFVLVFSSSLFLSMISFRIKPWVTSKCRLSSSPVRACLRFFFHAEGSALLDVSSTYVELHIRCGRGGETFFSEKLSFIHESYKRRTLIKTSTFDRGDTCVCGVGMTYDTIEVALFFRVKWFLNGGAP